MSSVLLVLAAVVILVDAVLFFAKPRWLARLAVLPLGLRRNVVLPQRLRSELAVSTSGGYRDGSHAIDLMRLAPALAARNWNILDASVALQPEGWVLVLVKHRARSFRVFNLRPWAVARIDLTARGEALELHARYLPAGTFGASAFFAAVAIAPPFELRSVIAGGIMWLLFIVVTGVSCRASVHDAMLSVEDALLQPARHGREEP